MQVGRYEVTSLETGNFRLDGGAMFGVVPKVLWQKTNPSDELNRILMGLRALVVRAGERVILVDCGIGQRWDAKFVERYGVDHATHELNRALKAKGLTRDMITDVIVSHLHFDHVGGATQTGVGGKVELTFPRAKHYVQAENQAHAKKPTEKDRASFIESTIRPLAESGKLVSLDGAMELLPGIQILVSQGHSPGQQLLKVSDEGKTVLFCGDLIPTATHIPIPYAMGYDLYPVTVMEEKRQLLPQAYEEGWLLAWSHDPSAAASLVSYEDGKFRRGADVAL